MQLPKLVLSEWEETRLYLQLICQIVGKTRLRLHPRVNHWWHVPLYLSARGPSTGGIPTAKGELDITVDLVSHAIVIRLLDTVREVPLGEPICEVYRHFLSAMDSLGIDLELDGRPYKCKSEIPFAEDLDHRTYVPEDAIRALSVWSALEGPFKEFRGRFVGKCSPVHLFWHSFDLACTRFSGRRAPAIPGAGPVTAEAYSHEVISAGFWFGDDLIPEAALYCYTAPSPARLQECILRPAEAEWVIQSGAPMALLSYEHLRQSTDPALDVLEFLQSSYEAGAESAGWNRSELELDARSWYGRQPN